MPNRTNTLMNAIAENTGRDAYGTFRSVDLAHRHVHILDTDLRDCEALGILFRLEGYHSSFSTSANQFITALNRQAFDVVIANLDLGDETGLNIIRRIRDQKKGIVTVMLANTASVDSAVMAMKLGAVDVLCKPVDTEYLLRVVREALLRNVQLFTAQNGSQTVEVRGFSQLTPREREVLTLICNGHSNKQIALQLGISPRTIEVHRLRLKNKLGARNTADLMKIVLTS